MHSLGMLLLAAGLGLCWIVPQPAPAAPFSSAGCRACHDIPDVLSHPMGPAGSTSGGLPLEAGGLIGCATCHDERASRADHGSLAGDTGLLRLPAGRLCASCHGRGADAASALAHGLGLGRAHLAPLGAPEREPASGLDAETRDCLGCHDGSVAGVASVAADSAVQRIGRQRSSVEAEHPIGVRYDGLDATSMRTRSSLHPLASLPEEIRLAQGRIGCGSCHSVYSGSPAMLVRSTRHGGLCLDCHIK